jgi:hypothetical protein
VALTPRPGLLAWSFNGLNTARGPWRSTRRTPFVDVSHLRYTAAVKTATIPSIRVEPELRAEMESVLIDGETLSEFVEASVRAGVERRRIQAEFITRGLRSRDDARRTGRYVDADTVLAGLQRKLDTARKQVAKKRR